MRGSRGRYRILEGGGGGSPFNCYRVPTQVLQGLIMSYFSFYIYKAIRKVLFLPIFSERL